MGGGMSANQMTRRRFFQSAAGSRWDEELNVIDERVEKARDTLKYQGHRILLGFWIEKGSEKMRMRMKRRMRSLCL